MNWLDINKVTIFNGKDENGNRYLSQFLRDYKDTFNPDEINAGCDRCLEDYYKKFTKYLSTMSAKNTNSGYKLKAKYDGIPLEFGSPIQVHNANITDELATKLIKNHPKGKDLFEAIPEKKANESEDADKSRLELLNDMKRPDLDALAINLGLDPKEYSNKGLISSAIDEAEKKANESEVITEE